MGETMTPFAQDRIRRRLPRSEREKLIIDEAIRFFAEVGFEGQTRALAMRLGVTQPLLYRYFTDKESLIERVYDEVFISGWDQTWEHLLTDRSKPLADRIKSFYQAYHQANFNYERVRLFLFAGLKDQALAERYMAFIHQHLIEPLCHEVRHAAGIIDSSPLRDSEIECVAALHGAVGYVGMRRWVYGAAIPDLERTISTLVDTFLSGALNTFKSLRDDPGPIAEKTAELCPAL